jgi:type IV secretory pathway TrbD component
MTTWEIVDEDDAKHFVTHISAEGRKRLSDEGLRRSASDNALLAATARTHEILAGTACGGIVVALVWAIFRGL